MNNYYKILKLEELASIDEVKKAFKRLALVYHPDKNPDNPVAEELFKQINEAYQVLSDPITKNRYDYLLQLAYSYRYYEQKRPYQTSTTTTTTHHRESPKTNLYATILAFVVLAYMFMVVSSVYEFVSRYNYYQALRAYQAKDYGVAFRRLNISVGYDAYFAPAHYLRAKVYQKHHNYPEGALKAFTTAIETTPILQSHFFLDRGLTYSQLQEKVEAINDLNTVLQLTNFETQTAKQIAQEYQYQLREYDLAIDVYDVLLQRHQQQDSIQAKIYYHRGIAYATLHKEKLAQVDFDSAVSKSTTPLTERLAITLALKDEVKNYELALQNASLLIEKKPQEADYYFLRALIFIANGQSKAALRDISVAIAYQPTKQDYFKLRAKVLLELDRVQEACTDWLAARRLGNTEKHSVLDFFCETDSP